MNIFLHMKVHMKVNVKVHLEALPNSARCYNDLAAAPVDCTLLAHTVAHAVGALCSDGGPSGKK